MPQDEIEVPESLKSAETYEFIGFDKKTALEIWSRFISTSDPDDPEGDFMGYARSYVNHSGVPDALSVLDDWTSTMNRLGINKTLQSAIMLPEFDDLRSTASCKFWVLDSMTVAYATLEHLNDQLRSEMARRQRISKTGHRDMSQPPARPAPISRNQSVSRPGSRDADAAAAGLSVSEEEAGAVSVSVPEAPERLDGHTMIWRGCSRLSALEFGEGHPDHLVLRAMRSSPGDFSYAPVVYFTPQRETADRYATWLKHKVPASEVAIFQAAVPKDLIRSLSVNYLWSDGVETDTWKRVIWHSRRSEKLPKDLRWMADKDLWIGHIARSLHSRYVAMESYTMIESSDTLSVKIDGDWRKAIQWVFYDSDAEDLFALSCKGKTWIHSTGKLVDETPK